MDGLLPRRHRSDKKPDVVPQRQVFRRDPVGKIAKPVTCEREIFILEETGKGDFSLEKKAPVMTKPSPVGIFPEADPFSPGVPGQENAHLLESLPDRRHPGTKGDIRGGAILEKLPRLFPGHAGQAFRHFTGAVFPVEGASGKHVRSGNKGALGVPEDHEDFEPARLRGDLPQQDQRGRLPGLDDHFLHSFLVHGTAAFPDAGPAPSIRRHPPWVSTGYLYTTDPPWSKKTAFFSLYKDFPSW